MFKTLKEFKEAAHAEFLQAKQRVTPEEIENLDFENFNPRNKFNCFLAQLADSYASKRSLELAPKTLENLPGDSLFYSKISISFKDAKAALEKGKSFSLIEFYFYLRGAKPKNVYDFFQGKVDTLIL